MDYNAFKEPKDFVSLGYEVRPSVNGGFVVLPSTHSGGQAYRTEHASFSNSSDLFAWLKQGHTAYDAGVAK